MTGKQLKLQGMSKSVEKHKTELDYIRGIARYVAGTLSIISIEDVRRQAAKEGHHWQLGNAAGSVFTSDDWQFAGFMVSDRKETHSRIIRTWRLRKA